MIEFFLLLGWAIICAVVWNVFKYRRDVLAAFLIWLAFKITSGQVVNREIHRRVKK